MVQGLEIVLIFLTPARAVPSHKYGDHKRINLVSVWRILAQAKILKYLLKKYTEGWQQ